jgi:RNA polymerase sigma-70 factor (ECF subfamily)
MMDETRFRAFYQEMYPRIWSYVHRMVSERSECDDFAQESFLRFLRSAPPKLPDADQRSYLYKIATNLVKDSWRARQSQTAWLAEQGDEEPVSESEGAITASVDINRALDLLPPGQRSLVWLAYVEGYEHKEIAEIVGVNPASVRVLLMRARKRLAEFLSEDANERRHE